MFSRWSRLNGIRIRVAAFVFVTASFFLILFGFLISKQVIDFHRREFDNEFYNLALDASQEIGYVAADVPTAPLGGFTFGKKSVPFSGALSFFQIRGPDGSILYRSANLGSNDLPWVPADWRALVVEDVVFRDLKASDLHVEDVSGFRMVSIPLRQGRAFRGVLQIAAPTDEIDKEKEQLNNLFAMIIPILVVSLALGSFWIAGSALVPLKELIARTRGIAPADLSVRLPVPQTGDEIADLSRTLNGMLERIQSAFESQERFVSDASHQLKTPLAVLRGEIELMRGKETSRAQIGMFLDSAHEEVTHLSKLVEGLLLLARVSALPEAALVRSPVRLDELMIVLLERYRSALDRGGLKCRFHVQDDHEPLEVLGDEDLLRSLFETLVENAIKYSPQGGLIEVALDSDPRSVNVRISDQGRGIPSGQREQVFERFYRADLRTQGFGLGLTVARQIVLAHRGEIEIEEREGWGACVRVKMKKTSSGFEL